MLKTSRNKGNISTCKNKRCVLGKKDVRYGGFFGLVFCFRFFVFFIFGFFGFVFLLKEKESKLVLKRNWLFQDGKLESKGQMWYEVGTRERILPCMVKLAKLGLLL